MSKVVLTLLVPTRCYQGRWPWELVLDRHRNHLEVLLGEVRLDRAASCEVECRQNALRSHSAEVLLAEEHAESP